MCEKLNPARMQGRALQQLRVLYNNYVHTWVASGVSEGVREEWRVMWERRELGEGEERTRQCCYTMIYEDNRLKQTCQLFRGSTVSIYL